MWVKFAHDTDDPIMTSMITSGGNAGWGGTIFHIGNTNTTGRQINIQFEPGTGYLRVYVHGSTNPISTVSYQSTKYTAGTWLLCTLSIENTNVKVHINGVEHLSFEIEQLLIDAYNDQYGTSVTSLTNTSWSTYLSNFTRWILILRDIPQPNFTFSLWNAYILERALTDAEHLGLYTHPIP